MSTERFDQIRKKQHIEQIEKKQEQLKVRKQLLLASFRKKENRHETRAKILFGAVVIRDYTTEQLNELILKMTDRDKQFIQAWLNSRQSDLLKPSTVVSQS